jgi:hypothetical protein
MEKDFTVCTDASKQGLGACANAGWRSDSLCIKEVEETRRAIYATHDLELAAVMLALKLWRHYLVG